MKVNDKRDISFGNLYTNKAVKRGLEFASSNGALFGAAATLAFSAIRPVSILCTPKTDKENKKIAASKSITSSLINFILMLAISVPLALSVKKIDSNPKKYLKNETIKNLKDKEKILTDSKGYIFATQLFKLGAAALVALPKSYMTAKGMPYIVNMLSSDKMQKNEQKSLPPNNPTSFKGLTDKTAKNIGKTINNKKIIKFINKFKDTNFPMHITAITDTIATLGFMFTINKTNTIEEKRKKTLLYNAGLSTGLSIASGYTIDKLLEKPTDKFIKKYKELNKNDKNLSKQIQGIKIAKPLIILGTIYYILIPLISTFAADRADKY